MPTGLASWWEITGPGLTCQLLQGHWRAHGQGVSALPFKKEGEHKTGTHQFLYLQTEFQQAPASLIEALGVLNATPSHQIRSDQSLSLVQLFATP